jgi:hypothetical protein
MSLAKRLELSGMGCRVTWTNDHVSPSACANSAA